MPNGEKRTTRDYVMQTHEAVGTLKRDFRDHKKDHQFIWKMIFTVPASLAAVLAIVAVLIRMVVK